MDYTLDTNIISALLKENKKIQKKLQQTRIRGSRAFITAVTYYEVKRGLLATNATKRLKKFEELSKTMPITYPNKAVFDKAAEIYADLKGRGQLIPDADILIASAAIVNNLILVSDNTEHFQRIEGLTLENWLR